MLTRPELSVTLHSLLKWEKSNSGMPLAWFRTPPRATSPAGEAVGVGKFLMLLILSALADPPFVTRVFAAG
jgi:hypothetical protein